MRTWMPAPPLESLPAIVRTTRDSGSVMILRLFKLSGGPLGTMGSLFISLVYFRGPRQTNYYKTILYLGIIITIMHWRTTFP